MDGRSASSKRQTSAGGCHSCVRGPGAAVDVDASGGSFDYVGGDIRGGVMLGVVVHGPMYTMWSHPQCGR